MSGRVLVTGGAGFLGGFLTRALLARGCQVHLVDDLSRGRRDRFLEQLLASGRVELSPGRLEDLPEGAGPYARIFHLAARVGVAHVLRRPYETLREGALSLCAALELARRQPALERFVFASTSEVYAAAVAASRAPVPTPEDAALLLPPLSEPRSSYALSKLYGEALVIHSTLPFTVVRPHNVYGPRMGRSHVVPELLERAWRAPEGGRLQVFSPEHRRTFCFVDDAVEMILRASESESGAGQVLNVGAEAPELSMAELAGLVIRTVGRELALEPGPVTPGSPPRRCPDMARTAALTGWHAATAPEEGLRRTWEWYRAELEGGREAQLAR